jgi:hypothetical protein
MLSETMRFLFTSVWTFPTCPGSLSNKRGTWKLFGIAETEKGVQSPVVVSIHRRPDRVLVSLICGDLEKLTNAMRLICNGQVLESLARF